MNSIPPLNFEKRETAAPQRDHTPFSLSLSLSLVSSRSSQRRGVALDVAGMRRFLGDAATKLRRRIATSSRASRTRGNRTRFVDFVGSGYLRSTSPALGGLICFLLLLFFESSFFFLFASSCGASSCRKSTIAGGRKSGREKKKRYLNRQFDTFFFVRRFFFS